MNGEYEPIIGNWYRHLDKGQSFQVVAVDEETGTIELQHFDGDLEEVDRETWMTLPIQPIEEPENWSGAFDIGEVDDLGTEVTDTAAGDWSEPLDETVKPRERPVGETDLAAVRKPSGGISVEELPAPSEEERGKG